jgi:hypothetical protein
MADRQAGQNADEMSPAYRPDRRLLLSVLTPGEESGRADLAGGKTLRKSFEEGPTGGSAADQGVRPTSLGAEVFLQD